MKGFLMQLSSTLQLFPGEKHAFIFFEDHETEMRELRVRATFADAKHFVRKHQERNVTL
jgi:hypothetical protein